MQKSIEFLSGNLKLEGIVSIPESKDTIPCVILCHPHPLYGGNMYNNIIIDIAQNLYKFGIATLLFNFRGAGNSEGTFDNGIGEVSDIISAYNYVSNLPNINPDKLGIAGYSFGASTTLDLFIQIQTNNIKINVQSFAFIACPSSNIQTHLSTNTNLIYQSLSSNKLFVYGDTDELIDEDVYNNLLRTICKPKEIIKINNTDHFFSNVIPKLSNKIGDFFNSTLK
tara:strand:- start:487 stop:1161 length:675 start_codon:yes stop_codon:yes gene_type:complete